jgi:hypothetical protein
MAEAKKILEDEVCRTKDNGRLMTGLELIEAFERGDFDGEVKLHNTMRFDVQMGWIQPMLDDKDPPKDVLVKSIREAIIKAVADACGLGDGYKHCGPFSHPVRNTQMLHRETISYDFS